MAPQAGGGRQPVARGRCDKVWFRPLERATRVSTTLLAFRAVPQLCSSSAATFGSSVLFQSFPHHPTGWLPFFKHQRISQILRTKERILRFAYYRHLGFVHIPYRHPHSIWIYNLRWGLRGIHSTYRSHFFSRTCSNIRLQMCVRLLSLASVTVSFGSAIVKGSQDDVTQLLYP